MSPSRRRSVPLPPVLSAFGGGRFFGGRTGTGAPVVLALHGWRRTHRDFDALVAGAGVPLDAVAVDLPGFGATPEPPAPWGSPEYAEALVPVVEEMATPLVVLGHSFGGRVALHLAAARPDLVRALVLTGVPHLVASEAPIPRPPTGYRLVRRLHRVGLVGEARMEAARQRYGSPDYRAAQGVMRQVFVTTVQERYDQVLARLRCPVTLVWGEEDTEAPLAMASAALPLLAEGSLTVLPGIGHLTPTEAPSELRRAVEEALG